MKYIDLFCGMGSFHYSFNKIGGECVYACDNNKDAQDTYELNWGMRPDGDILDLDPSTLPDFDCLCAGFPCQPFSRIGKRKGLQDDRGGLIYTIIDILNEKTPEFFILENVRGLLNHDKGKTYELMSNLLKEAGYNINHKVLKCEDYGIPQLRRRLFIVGSRNTTPKMNYEATGSPTLSEFFGRNFERDYAFTLRCGGRHSPINDRRNWDGYIVDGEEYRLTIDDMLKLQGFHNYKFNCKDGAAMKMLGNTIPTTFTKVVIEELYKE